jgi:myo-inositol-1(or 4)-monophosphatase
VPVGRAVHGDATGTLSAVPDLADLRALAIRAADAGAAVVRDAFVRAADAAEVERKGYGDYVTLTDRAAERAVLDVLRAGAPEIPVLAEESAPDALAGPPEGRVWAVDPLDGTTNFLRRFPVVGVSVGLLEDGLPVAGAIAAPLLGAAWSAARGLGAHAADGRALRVRADDGRGVASTGFPFRKPHNRPRYLAIFERALEVNEDLRRAGAAALDLAYAAEGVFDGFFELGLSLWDVAAGGIVVIEAGGLVTDWSGDPRGVYRSGDVLAGAPGWHERMLALTRSAAVIPRTAVAP